MIEASRKPLLWRGLGRPFTATGIAPELNRIPILIPYRKHSDSGTNYAANVKSIKWKFKK
jgi:hypothetical protein